MKKRDQLFLIGGAPRSGTSAVAGVLYHCGLHMEFDHRALELQVPGRPGAMRDATRSDGKYDLYEVSKVFSFNESILNRCYGGLDNPPPESMLKIDFDLLAVMATLGSLIPKFPFALKDPRFAFTFSLWKRALEKSHQMEIIAVMVIRHPLEGAKALLKRGHVPDSVTALDLWLRINRQIKNLHDKYGAYLIQYSGDREAFQDQMEALCGKLKVRFSQKGFSKAFSPSKPDRLSESELQSHPLGEVIRNTYEYLVERTVSAK